MRGIMAPIRYARYCDKERGRKIKKERKTREDHLCGRDFVTILFFIHLCIHLCRWLFDFMNHLRINFLLLNVLPPCYYSPFQIWKFLISFSLKRKYVTKNNSWHYFNLTVVQLILNCYFNKNWMLIWKWASLELFIFLNWIVCNK